MLLSRCYTVGLRPGHRKEEDDGLENRDQGRDAPAGGAVQGADTELPATGRRGPAAVQPSDLQHHRRRRHRGRLHESADHRRGRLSPVDHQGRPEEGHRVAQPPDRRGLHALDRNVVGAVGRRRRERADHRPVGRDLGADRHHARLSQRERGGGVPAGARRRRRSWPRGLGHQRHERGAREGVRSRRQRQDRRGRAMSARSALTLGVALAIAVLAVAPAGAAPAGEVKIGLAAEPNTFDFLLPVRLGELFGLMLSPKHTNAVGKEAIATRPNGTGPFKLVSWTKNEQMVLEANESYWRGAPKVKKIIVRPILEDAARIAALQAGEVDLITPIPYARIAELKRNDKLVIKTVAAPRIFHVTIDVRKPPFDNVKVRQALNYGVDVNAIVKSLYFGYGTRLATVVDRGGLGYDPGVQPYPFDPTKAKALLAEAGFPNGFETEFDSFTGSIADHAKPAEAIVGYLQKNGVKAKQNVFEFAAFGPRRVQNKTAPLFIYRIGDAYLEPSWVIRWLTQGGLGMHYKNPKLDEMLTRIEATDDRAKRAPQYSDVQKLIKDEAPFIFLFQADAVFGMSTRIDYTPRPDETQWLYPLGIKG